MSLISGTHFSTGSSRSSCPRSTTCLYGKHDQSPLQAVLASSRRSSACDTDNSSKTHMTAIAASICISGQRISTADARYSAI